MMNGYGAGQTPNITKLSPSPVIEADIFPVFSRIIKIQERPTPVP